MSNSFRTFFGKRPIIKLEEPDLKDGHSYLPTKRNANYVEVDTYLKELKKVKKQLGVPAG
jgi:hypothetical protein